jgi:hypothetical protein
LLHHLNFHTLCNRRLHLEAFFLIDVYSGFTPCPFLLQTVGVRVPTQHFRDFPLFTAAFSNKSGLSAKRGEPVSSVIIVSGYGLDDRAIEVQSPAEAKDISCSLCVQTSSGAHQASCTVGTWGLFPGSKGRTGRDADHSPPCSAEVENEQELYILSPQTPFVACSGTALALVLLNAHQLLVQFTEVLTGLYLVTSWC